LRKSSAISFHFLPFLPFGCLNGLLLWQHSKVADNLLPGEDKEEILQRLGLGLDLGGHLNK
jgi:hypothetical protein